MNNILLNEISYEKQNLKHFHVLSVLYILGILTSLTVSARLFPFEIPFTHLTILLTGGTWTIPFTFFIQDITTEVYGYAKSKQLILLSIPIVVIYITYLKFTTLLPIPNVPNIGNSYNEVFNALPRHLIALLAAIAIGTTVNNFVLSKLKTRFKGKYLPLRFISSTAIGEASLQIIGTTIAWFGSLRFTSEILPFVIFSYFYKISFEAIMTPVNIYICKWLKNDEGIDVYDN
jgi:queuosine precursor transporter